MAISGALNISPSSMMNDFMPFSPITLFIYALLCLQRRSYPYFDLSLPARPRYLSSIIKHYCNALFSYDSTMVCMINIIFLSMMFSWENNDLSS